MDDVTFRPGRVGDTDAIRALLVSAALPVADLTDGARVAFLLTRTAVTYAERRGYERELVFELDGGREQRVRAGEVIALPAGVPHGSAQAGARREPWTRGRRHGDERIRDIPGVR